MGVFIWSNLALLVVGRERQLATGKRAERTKHDFRRPICRSAIGQAICLICARRRQLKFPFCSSISKIYKLLTFSCFVLLSLIFDNAVDIDGKNTDEISYITVHLEAKTNKTRKLTRTEQQDVSYWNKKNKHFVCTMRFTLTSECDWD